MSSTSPTVAEAAKRRRASRACLACRERKVRCDVVFCGKPCTNCRLDFSDCVVQMRRKNRCHSINLSNRNRILSIREAETEENNSRVSRASEPGKSSEPTAATLPVDQHSTRGPAEKGTGVPAFSWNDTLDRLMPAADTSLAVSLPGPAPGLSSLPATDISGPFGDSRGLQGLGVVVSGSGHKNKSAQGENAEVARRRSGCMIDEELLAHELLDDAAGSFSFSTFNPDDLDLNPDGWSHLQFPLPPSFFTDESSAPMSFPSFSTDTIAGGSSVSNGLPLQPSRHTHPGKAPATKPSTKPTSLSVPRNSMFLVFSCYPFLSTRTLWSLDQEDDAIFLEQKGCLHVPKKQVLDEFMEQYFLHVHPFMPLINELDFWTMYNAPAPPSSPDGQMSLFVFQAMLFVACPFVSQSTLSDLDFASVPEARASFYRRAKSLFHLEEGRDDISTAQGALMLTYHAPDMSDRTNSFWLSTAIHYAKSAGAHRYNSDAAPKIFRKRTILKRLWWCCVLRDKIMALGLGRPMQIGPTEFDMAQPALSENDTGDEITGSVVYTPATKRLLGQFLTALCDLAVVLTDILAMCHPATAPGGMVVNSGEPAVYNNYIAALDAWYEATAAKFSASIDVSDSAVESLMLFTNAAYIYYYTAKASVYKHMSQRLVKYPDSAADDSSSSWVASPPAQVDESFRGVTKSLAKLKERNLVRYLPNTFVSFAVLPFKWQLAGFRATDGKAVSKESDLKTYHAVFEGFGELYEITDSALKSIGSPMLLTGNVCLTA